MGRETLVEHARVFETVLPVHETEDRYEVADEKTIAINAGKPFPPAVVQ